ASSTAVSFSDVKNSTIFFMVGVVKGDRLGNEIILPPDVLRIERTLSARLSAARRGRDRPSICKTTSGRCAATPHQQAAPVCRSAGQCRSSQRATLCHQPPQAQSPVAASLLPPPPAR